ncbi:hypothetical protein GGI17_002715 [Coemansia sp. S146]|nr:hypothetical protein GGI17_002715 [Coemansia sp. S146]
MDNPAQNKGNESDLLDHAQIRHILRTFDKTLEVLEGACGEQTNLRARVARLVYRIAAPITITAASFNAAASSILDSLAAVSPPDNRPVTGPAAARSASPASNDQAAVTLSVAHRNTGTVAGPAAVSALRPHLPTATLSIARPTAAENDKACDPDGEALATLPLRKRQRFGPQVVEVIEISSDEEGNGSSASRPASTPLFLSTVPPSASCPVAVTVAGSSAAFVALTRLTTATPSTARLTWAQKGKGQAPPGDGPPTPPLHMCQIIDPWVVEEVVISSDKEGDGPSVNMNALSSAWEALPDIGPSSLLDMFLQISDCNHGDNPYHGSVEENNLATVVHDSSGETVTSIRMLLVFESFFHMTLVMFATLYCRKFGCKLIPKGSDPHVALEALGALEGFRLHSAPVKNTGSDQAVNLTVLLRDGPEFEIMYLDLKSQLGLTKTPILPIPESLMCYSVVMLGCMPLDQQSSAVLQDIISTITGVGFDTLPIATSKGIRRMSYGDLCSMSSKWVHDLCNFAIKSGDMDKTLGMATRCHKAYANECYANGNTNTDLDPNSAIAKRMFRYDVCNSQLLLGIHKPKFGTLFKHLTFAIKDDNDKDIKKYIKNVSDSLF